MHACVFMYVPISVFYRYTCVLCIYVYVSIRIGIICACLYAGKMYAYMPAYLFVCICTHMYAYFGHGSICMLNMVHKCIFVVVCVVSY